MDKTLNKDKVFYRKPYEKMAYFSEIIKWSNISSDEGFLFQKHQGKIEIGIFDEEPKEYVIKKDLIWVKPFVKTLNNIDNDYIILVNRAISEIKKNQWQKIVTSAALRVQLLNNLDHKLFFECLCIKYPKSFVYFVEKEGMEYYGVSPEIVLKSGEDNWHTTFSLAGTKQGTEKWTDKLYHEQEIVTQSIMRSLKKINANPIRKGALRTSKIGHLQHLKTAIHFKSQLSKDKLLRQIHPTPALVGMPQKEALDFINKYENYSRDYYTGLVGLYDKNAIIMANLRCMKKEKDTLIFYAGGGITQESNATDELLEIKRKLGTLLQFFVIHE